MKPVLIVPIEIYPQIDLSNYSFVLKIEGVDQMQNALDIAKEQRQCKSILCEFGEVSVETILKMDIKSPVNMYINCTFEGDMLSVIKSIKKEDTSKPIMYLFPPETPQLVTLLKILSSCGYKSGVKLSKEGEIDKDTFIELASYSYLSPVPHAQIEPFGYIQQEIHDKKVKYVDVCKLYFEAPDTFAQVAKDGSIHLVSEFPELRRKLCDSVDEISKIDFSGIALEYRKLRFYNHFDNEDDCSKCAHFKICSGFYKNRFVDCQEVMSTIYEMLF